jgi:hypothetical protein
VGVRAGRAVRASALVLVALAVAACWGIFQPDNAFTIVNRTTVPVVVEDDGSVSVVQPCAQRTLGWAGTWGGHRDAYSNAYTPVAEPVPSGAWVLPRENVPRVFEGPSVDTVVVTTTKVGDEPLKYGGPDPNAPCEGTPPPSPTPSPTASASARG